MVELSFVYTRSAQTCDISCIVQCILLIHAASVIDEDDRNAWRWLAVWRDIHDPRHRRAERREVLDEDHDIFDSHTRMFIAELHALHISDIREQFCHQPEVTLFGIDDRACIDDMQPNLVWRWRGDDINAVELFESHDVWLLALTGADVICSRYDDDSSDVHYITLLSERLENGKKTMIPGELAHNCSADGQHTSDESKKWKRSALPLSYTPKQG